MIPTDNTQHIQEKLKQARFARAVLLLVCAVASQSCLADPVGGQLDYELRSAAGLFISVARVEFGIEYKFGQRHTRSGESALFVNLYRHGMGNRMGLSFNQPIGIGAKDRNARISLCLHHGQSHEPVELPLLHIGGSCLLYPTFNLTENQKMIAVVAGTVAVVAVAYATNDNGKEPAVRQPSMASLLSFQVRPCAKLTIRRAKTS